MSIAPTTDIPALTAATDRLLATVAALSEADLAAPSLLPGWSRGHVLAHLARNADGLTNLLTGARTGVPTPMYASMEARERDIEAGAGHGVAEQLADLRASAARLAEAIRTLPEAAWSAEVPHRHGAFPAAEVPARRIRELYYHHVDLALPQSYSPADWPAPWVRAELVALSARFKNAPGLGYLVLLADDTESSEDAGTGAEDLLLETGAPPANGNPDFHVSGPAARLLAWLSGRSDGADLDLICHCFVMEDAAANLPKLPPLG